LEISSVLRTLWRDITVNTIIASKVVPRGLRGPLLTWAGLGVHPRARVSAGCFFGGRDISIGDHSFVNYGCFFDGGAAIHIGDGVAVGYEVMFVNSTHALGEPNQRAGTATSEAIHVAAGCWIGARAVLLPGVRLEEGVVVAAGAVVTTDCAANGLYAGVPARRVKDLPS
jgi:maltose O-acetyltransferase